MYFYVMITNVVQIARFSTIVHFNVITLLHIHILLNNSMYQYVQFV